ncbi:MAG: teicoplanin resistance protein VanZ [Zymomonas mobilis subsp. pomaceae]|uniref:teicoplanin resistance protein VanZ n=1 Tax=Zymomonas mobilis TaxID=542 RepID=UPI00208DAE81|nr:teicoplanin resistance protein VanZ [Zymomonas mobilis]MDX5948428.1 teicoplanin resistance protein VanZ [Zymomonas mobilis subsp. pomaceae]
MGAYICAVIPSADTLHLAPSDKIDHILAFLLLTTLACLGWPKVQSLKLAFRLAAFGAFIELTQAIPFIHRDAELADWFADMSAILGILFIRNITYRYFCRSHIQKQRY